MNSRHSDVIIEAIALLETQFKSVKNICPKRTVNVYKDDKKFYNKQFISNKYNFARKTCILY